MLLLKLITILLLTLILWTILRVFLGVFKVARVLKASFNPQNYRTHGHQHQARAARPTGQNTMVKCSACELYILDSEAVQYRGYYYCSPEHAQRS